MSTYDIPLRYKTFCTRYDTYRMIHIAYHMILTIMTVYIKEIYNIIKTHRPNV